MEATISTIFRDLRRRARFLASTVTVDLERLTFRLPERTAPPCIPNYLLGTLTLDPAVTCTEFHTARRPVQLLRRSAPPELNPTCQWAIWAVATPGLDNMTEEHNEHDSR